MDVLLSTATLKANLYNKENVQEKKRKENMKHCKTAREGAIMKKRRIPENLEYTDDSVYIKTVKTESLKRTEKPSRLELLNEWKKNKEKLKINSRPRKAPFVVRHLIYKDDVPKENFSNAVNKEFQKPKEFQSKDKQSKVLQERNINSMRNDKNEKRHNEEFKKQTYADWKKQPVKDRQPVQPRRTTRDQTVVKEKPNNAKNNSRQQITKPITRSVKSIVKENKGKGKLISNENANTNQRKSSLEMKRIGLEHQDTILKENLSETYELDKNKTVADINEAEIEKIKPLSPLVGQDVVPIESIVSEPTEFKVPYGLAFSNFKFDTKTCSPNILTEVESTINKNKTVNSSSPKSENEQQKLNVNMTPKCVLGPTAKSTSFKTPVALFKEKNDLTPHTTLNQQNSAKRTSLTPNPKNFLYKIDDPVAQRIESASKASSASISPDASDTVKHFSGLVEIEETKFAINIEKWNSLLEKSSIPEEAQGSVLSAIGQAQLLMRKRFKQFKELIDLHKDKSAEKAAHASDLDGFWEMIYFQVDDVHKRFEELEKLQANNWQEQVPIKKEPDIKKPKKVPSKKQVATKKVTSRRPDFKMFREEMKAKKMSEEANQCADLTGTFVTVMTTCITDDGRKIATPVQRSINTMSENSHDVSLLIPLEQNIGPDFKCNAPVNAEEFSADSLEEYSPDNKQKDANLQKENVVCSLRRSSRKMPSRYCRIGFSAEKKPEDVACNLFESEVKTGEEEKTGDFTKYLSKTILVQDQPVKRDLLSSFDEPVALLNVCSAKAIDDDLMVFSPVVSKVDSKKLHSSIQTSQL